MRNICRRIYCVWSTNNYSCMLNDYEDLRMVDRDGEIKACLKFATSESELSPLDLEKLKLKRKVFRR